ncbi:MAG: hypothetical protein GYB31_19525 [Bacteroidetes bacterium]|nr:hypothetical protein [Bacteroidota bacterium]
MEYFVEKMKKPNTRTFLLAFMVMVSLCCYIFLASHSSEASVSYGQSVQTEEAMETEESEFALPEVMLVKEIIDIGKRVIHFTR